MDPEVKRRLEAIERRLDILEGKYKKVSGIKQKEQEQQNIKYKKGSTIHKILILKEEGFFDSPKTISEIVAELKSKDYHLRASDLTLPLRRIVRKSILIRTKKNSDGTESKNWMYVKK